MISNAQEARAKTEAAIKAREEAKYQHVNVLYHSILKAVDMAASEGDNNLEVSWMRITMQECGQAINHVKKADKVAIEILDFKKVYVAATPEVIERLQKDGFSVTTGRDTNDNSINLYINW